jgi:hypothetical protein
VITGRLLEHRFRRTSGNEFEVVASVHRAEGSSRHLPHVGRADLLLATVHQREKGETYFCPNDAIHAVTPLDPVVVTSCVTCLPSEQGALVFMNNCPTCDGVDVAPSASLSPDGLRAAAQRVLLEVES